MDFKASLKQIYSEIYLISPSSSPLYPHVRMVASVYTFLHFMFFSYRLVIIPEMSALLFRTL